jgi:hypothetical protein
VARSLADVQADLVKNAADIEAAGYALAYGQGDRTATRQRITDLEARQWRLRREEAELTAYAAGATNPRIITPTWT